MAPLTQDAASATFSPCGTFRYTLTRTWDPSVPPLVVLMCNPSTADETANDPTVARCQSRAQRMGAGGLVVVNIFALRSTDPAMLYKVADPVGPDNDRAIQDVCRSARQVICAWGNPGKLLGRGAYVLDMLRGMDVPVFALALNADGSPKHPLYVRSDAAPFLIPLPERPSGTD